jgi:hypothetical protein
MQRLFAIDVLECPRCNADPMRILAAIQPPATTRAILNSLVLPSRAPPVAQAANRPVRRLTARAQTAGAVGHPCARRGEGRVEIPLEWGSFEVGWAISG